MTDISLRENIQKTENKSVKVEGTLMMACLKMIIYGAIQKGAVKCH